MAQRASKARSALMNTKTEDLNNSSTELSHGNYCHPLYITFEIHTGIASTVTEWLACLFWILHEEWCPPCEGELLLSDQLLIKEDPFMISTQHTDLFAKCMRELCKGEMAWAFMIHASHAACAHFMYNSHIVSDNL